MIIRHDMKLGFNSDKCGCSSCPIGTKYSKIGNIFYYTFLIVLPAFVIIHTIIASL